MWQRKPTVCKEVLDITQGIGNVILCGINRLCYGAFDTIPNTGSRRLDTVKQAADGAFHRFKGRRNLGFDAIYNR